MLLNMRFPFQERRFSFCKSIHFFSSLWTGLWSSGELAPPSLPFPCYFFPQTESLFTGYFFSGFRAISITQPKGQIPLKLNFASPGKVSVRALFWVPWVPNSLWLCLRDFRHRRTWIWPSADFCRPAADKKGHVDMLFSIDIIFHCYFRQRN